MSLPPLAIRVLLALLVTIAAVTDLRSRRVPNWLTLVGLVLAVSLNTFLFEWDGLWVSLKGMGLAFAVYFVMYLLRGMGAGDVKLMAAVGAAAGWMNWLAILVLTSLAGAIAGIGLIALRGRFQKTLSNLYTIILSLQHGQAPYKNNPDLDVRADRGLRLPHAVMIAIGTLAFLLVTWIHFRS